MLVKVKATSVNAGDWHVIRGEPFPLRFAFGLFAPWKTPIVGSDVAGIVESIGTGVTSLKVGDEVVCRLSSQYGGFAEKSLVISEDLCFLKPASMSFEVAASLPVAALTALQGLRDHAKLKSGQRILINGASGGVGSMAIQIAKSYNCNVTGSILLNLMLCFVCVVLIQSKTTK